MPEISSVREDPFQMMQPLFGHCSFGVGWVGLNACPDCLGHLFREELSKFKWDILVFWGGLNACQPAPLGWGTYLPPQQWFCKFSQIGPRVPSPRVPDWVRGGVNPYGQPDLSVAHWPQLNQARSLSWPDLTLPWNFVDNILSIAHHWILLEKCLLMNS